MSLSIAGSAKRAEGRVTRRRQLGLGVAVVIVALLAGAGMRAGDGRAAQASASETEFTFSPTRGIGSFDGFGVQLNQHLYADISGPPPNLAALEREVLSFRAPLVRIFFNTTAWTLADRLASFSRTVALAHRSAHGSTSRGREAVSRSRSRTCPASRTCSRSRSRRSGSASSG